MTVQKLNLKHLQRPEQPIPRAWTKRTFRIHSCLPILGATFPFLVMLDFDNFNFKRVKQLAKKIKRHFKLGGFIILKSSPNHYHVVFDRPVTWEKNMRVIAWSCYMSSFNVPMMRWLVMQLIKREPTLRVGVKARALISLNQDWFTVSANKNTGLKSF